MNIRNACIDDVQMLLNWRNDLETRRASHNMDVVELVQHRKWLESSLNNLNRKLMIAEVSGRPVGTVRADLEGDTWELSWTTAPECRGSGIAKKMVSKFASSILGHIRAEVKSDNIASQKVAESAGMNYLKTVNNIMHYYRD